MQHAGGPFEAMGDLARRLVVALGERSGDQLGIIAVTKGRSPSPGVPKATLFDLALGSLTVLVLALTVRGARRSRRWARRRAEWPLWRCVLRLVPHLVVPGVAAWVVGVLPVLRHNSCCCGRPRW